MKREIVIQATPEETRVVVLEDGRAAEIHVEREGDRDLVGAIFLGRVDRVVRGMQSAFVDVGLERHAFLFVADVLEALAPEAAATPRPAGAGDDDSTLPRRKATAARPIEEVLREGQRLLVQVTRDPVGHKGARVTTDVTLAGRFLVYLPHSAQVGVSKRIADAARREALRELLGRLREGTPGGLIARTAAEGEDEAALAADRHELVARWRSVEAAAAAASAPARLVEEPGLPVRVVRDHLGPDLARVVVDDEAAHGEVLAFVRSHAPSLAAGVHRYLGPTSVLEALGLETEIERALRPRAWLRSGGTIVINQMEALVAIDVNTGKYTGSRALEDTALRTNLEAAREVARQLRLRDLGGIIVVDFIDLVEPANREKVMAELTAALAADRAKTTVLGMSEFGLVQLTRQRQRRSLESTLCDPCPACSGTGRVKSVATTSAQVLRRARELVTAGAGGRSLEVAAHPDVARAVRDRLAALDRAGAPFPARLTVVDDAARHRDTFDLRG